MNAVKLESGNNPSNFSSNYSDKITLLKCPLGCMKCKRKVSEINQCYCESDQYQFNNEYQNSINSLREAFKKTLDLKEPGCYRCTQLLREVIIDSLHNIYIDLKKLSSGFYTKKRYKVSYHIAKNTLKELRSHIPGNQTITY